ncbi:MAG: putative transrane protein [Herbaspirillum sp.]|nr:putative transrane protein [Herbaspirillum sp.]
MKTDDLIDMLATGPVAVAPHATRRRYAGALACGAFGAMLLMLLFLGIRPDLAHAATLPLFRFKVAFVLSLTLLGLPIGTRLARPGATPGPWAWLLAAPLLILWIVAAITLADAAPDQRLPLLLGQTWKVCPFLIAMLSLPIFIALIRAIKGLAPTRLRHAGAAAGLLSGSLAALIYCLHCPEVQAPFIAVWYLLGMLIPTAAGALLGPRLLRW